MDPWYPWDFTKPQPVSGRDSRRFKNFLTFQTYLWKFTAYLLVPTGLFVWGLSAGWTPRQWADPWFPWTSGMSILWTLAASYVAKTLPDQLLHGSVGVTAPKRNRLAAILMAVTLCSISGMVLLKLTLSFENSAIWGRFLKSLFFCSGGGFLVWAVLYVMDFLKACSSPTPVYHLNAWDMVEFAKEKKPGEFELAHWSDLHLTAHDDDVSVSGDRGNNGNFRKLVNDHRADLLKMDALLVSGDVADAGRASEWHVFFREVPPELFNRMILVPGNHDMNIVDPSDWFMVEGQGRMLRKKRLIRTMAALNRVQGDRALILAPGLRGTPQEVGLKDYLLGFEAPFREFLDLLASQQQKQPGFMDYLRPPVEIWPHGKTDLRLEELGREVDRVWEQIFPMAVHIRGIKAVFLVLNSNTEDTGIVDNALGRLSAGALERLDLFHGKFAGNPLIHSLHHHVCLPKYRQGFLQDVQADMMALLNAGDFIQRLLPLGRSVVFHGHRHIGYNGILNKKIQVFSAPSTTLGNEIIAKYKRVPGFYSYRFPLRGQKLVRERHFWSAS